ncbi:hypothetical protein [Paraburkholderia youngii]|uniref:hypothetical protein n=1 Tax=Paraburkholderia youngii TaxID=2782701 RepID=UPI003D22350F
MFRTADGHTLELSPWRMRRLVRLVAEARRHSGNPSRSIAQDVRQLMARARRVAADGATRIARFESAGACCRACFLARQQAGAMQLVAMRVEPPVRLAARRYAHVHEQGPGEFEFESMPKSANLLLNWRHYETLESAERYARGFGVYILMRGAQPVYVGKGEPLAARLRTRRLIAQQHGDTGLHVWTATVPPGSVSAVEHVVVRALRDGLTNTDLRLPMRVDKAGLDIRRVLPPSLQSPYLVRNRVLRVPGDTFELTP